MEDWRQYDSTSSCLPKVIQIDHIKTFDDFMLSLGLVFKLAVRMFDPQQEDQ